MPTLVIPNSFTAGTVIQSAQVNANFTAISTLLNTTKLNSSNVQQYGLSLDRLADGTASYVLVRDASGHAVEAATITLAQGGTGQALTATAADAGKALVVDALGNIVVGAVNTPSGNIYNFFRTF